MNRTLILTGAEVAELIDLECVMPAVADAFAAWARGDAPAPGVLGVHVAGGGFHIKAATLGAYFAAKSNANFPGNPARFGLPSIQGVLVVCDAARGVPLAIMDSSRITALRTAAATGVAVSHLARRDAGVAMLIGCGAQAGDQLRAVSLVRQLQRVGVADVDAERASRFADEMTGELGIPVEPVELAAAAAADIVVTCTPATRPFLAIGDVAPGAMVAAVGADNPSKHEIAPELLASAKVVVDSRDQCAEIGDLHHAIASGRVRREDVHAELGEVVAGSRPGRESDDEIIVFDSTGTALQDVATAALVYERAVRSGQGTPVDLAG